MNNSQFVTAFGSKQPKKSRTIYTDKDFFESQNKENTFFCHFHCE